LIESPIASTVEAGRSLLTGKPRERFFGEIPQQFIGAVQGLPEGIRVAIRAFRTELSSDMLNKIDTKHVQAIPGKAGKAIRTPLRLLMASDELSKSIVYRAEMNAQAYRMAKMQGKDIAKSMADILDNLPESVMAKARLEAQYRTFNKPLGRIGNQLMNLRNSIPSVKYIIPFMRTPTNIAKFALERTPLNFARLAVKISKGEIKGGEISDELAKPIMGSMMAAATVMLAKQGLITGGGPKESNKREMLYRTGWQPYSLKIGDKYFSYARLEPLSSVVGMAADFGDMAFDNSNDTEIKDMAGKIALSFAKNISSKTFMSGLSRVLDAVSDPQRYGESFIGNYAGSLVPSAVSSLAQATDKTLRKTNGPTDVIQSRIPGQSEKLMPKRDIWGQEIERQGSPTERFISPIAVSSVQNDSVDKELLRLKLAPGQPDESIKDVKLTPEEYDQYSKNAGIRAKEMVQAAIQSNEYQAMSDDDRKDELTKTINRARQIERIRLKPEDKDIVSYVRQFTASKPVRERGEKSNHYNERLSRHEASVKMAGDELRYFQRDPDELQSLFIEAEKKSGRNVRRLSDGKVTAFGKQVNRIKTLNQ